MIIHRVIIDDDMDVHGHSSSGGYEKFGIDPSRGAIVVVRPDSVTGAIAPLQKIEALNEYFDGFLLPAFGLIGIGRTSTLGRKGVMYNYVQFPPSVITAARRRPYKSIIERTL